MPRLPKIAVPLLFCLVGLAAGAAGAASLDERNPFDPGRKPWKPAAQSLPPLTAADLKIEGIVSFGEFRGILALLDGKLKDTLPANRNGRVRIGVGQTFGAGYTLESVHPNHAVVTGGGSRYTIAIVRQIDRSTAVPAPALVQPAPAPHPQALPAPQPGAPAPGAAPFAPGMPGAPAAPGMPGMAPIPGQPAQPGVADTGQPAQAQADAQAQAGQKPPPSGQQQTSFIDALMRAQEAAKARGNPPPQPGLPFPPK